MSLIKKREKQEETAKNEQGSITVEGGLPGISIEDKFRYINMLLHGEAGTGKSTIAASACLDKRTAPILVLDCEGGAPLRFSGMPKNMFTIVKIDYASDVAKYYEYLKKGNHPYRSVIIDSLSELQKICLREFINVSKRVQRTKEIDFVEDVIDVVPAEMKEYNQSHLQMTRLVRFFRDLPMHVIFTSLSSTGAVSLTGKESDPKTMVKALSIPAKQGTDIPGQPDIVGQVEPFVHPETKAAQRIVRFQPARLVIAKDRTEALGQSMVFSLGDHMITQMLDLIWAKHNIKEEE